MKSKKLWYILGASMLIILLLWYFSQPTFSDKDNLFVYVKRGRFVIAVTTTGELVARNSENIKGPSSIGLRNARIWQYTIESIVPDGTVVDSGQWVATLGRSDLENKIKDQEMDVGKLENQYTQTQLDTTMNLRNARDELINMKYSLQEKQIVVSQSIYEPPATQRQVKLELDKAKRSFSQTKQNYFLKIEKASIDMKEVEAGLYKAKRKLNEMNKLKKEFTIYAPKAGMVIYNRSWDGKKQGVGAQISSWNNVVATLPNMTAMNSRTYVNEIDISKVRKGQKAIVSLDAFPDKKFNGVVSEVANIGQQLKNSNAKVFEVTIQIDGSDSILRPAMTTKNRIITRTFDSTLYLPVECIHNNDSISFVYQGHHKQQVLTGQSNDDDIIIRAGLKEGDKIYLSIPESAEKWHFKLVRP